VRSGDLCRLAREGAEPDYDATLGGRISLPSSTSSTSWGSLVRAQYRPLEKARMSGLFVAMTNECRGRSAWTVPGPATRIRSRSGSRCESPSSKSPRLRSLGSVEMLITRRSQVEILPRYSEGPGNVFCFQRRDRLAELLPNSCPARARKGCVRVRARSRGQAVPPLAGMLSPEGRTRYRRGGRSRGQLPPQARCLPSWRCDRCGLAVTTCLSSTVGAALPRKGGGPLAAHRGDGDCQEAAVGCARRCNSNV
jgi:hypothetical protein